MTRAPVNRRDPTGTRKIERRTIKRMNLVIDAYSEAMARVASGIDEGTSVARDTDRENNLMRLHDGMAEDLHAITQDWITETKDATVLVTDRVLNNLRTGIKLGDVSVPREEATLLAIGIQTNVRTVADDLLKDVSRIAAEGFLEGLGADQIARNIRDQALTTKYNAERMVRTETMRVCDVVAKCRYDAAGAEGFISYPTDDDRLCQKCIAYATGGSGTKLKVYGKDEPMSLPWHPNCRCCRIPYFEGMELRL